ncbi:MAG: hypothetical protein ABWZ99_08460 [Ilumatobacteraceae bacterium]
MAEPTRITMDDLVLTRVLYTDALIDPEATGLTAAEMAAVPWNDERWSADGQIRVGAAAWVASQGDRHVVIDPFGNADDIFHDRQFSGDHRRAMSAAFDAAGIPIDQVTAVVLSHIEGLGMSAVRGGDHSDVVRWVPFFPNATINVSEASRLDFESTPHDHWTDDVWERLFADDLVATYRETTTFLPSMTAEWTGAHNPGLHVFHFGDPSRPDATYVGHLAVSPLHLSTGVCHPQHPEPERAWELLHSFADDGRILLAPLWPSPGAGRWTGSEFVAVER